MKECNCGSGLLAEPQFDGYGIFLCSACPKCEEQKLGKFRSDIFERYDTDEPIEPDYWSDIFERYDTDEPIEPDY